MSRYFAAVALVAASTLAAPALASDAWFCAADMSTGFRVDTKTNKWGPTNFNAERQKFTVARKTNGMFMVTRMGDPSPSHDDCKDQGTGGKVSLVCGDASLGFRFSEDTLRFQTLYGFGYVEGEDTNANTPFLAIGKCAPIS